MYLFYFFYKIYYTSSVSILYTKLFEFSYWYFSILFPVFFLSQPIQNNTTMWKVKICIYRINNKKKIKPTKQITAKNNKKMELNLYILRICLFLSGKASFRCFSCIFSCRIVSSEHPTIVGHHFDIHIWYRLSEHIQNVPKFIQQLFSNTLIFWVFVVP